MTDKQSERDKDEWEYLTEEDFEVSDNEQSYYEEDSNDEDDDDDDDDEDGEDADSSRMLRQKPVDDEQVSRHRIKVHSIMKSKKVSS